MLESRHVVLRCANSLLLAGVLVWSTASWALGLGDITVHSALNQLLKADIALLDAGGLSESELSVSLATADEFGQAGIERVFFLNGLKFTPILRGNRTLIRVTSSKPVNEPFLNFLVQLNQPNGRLLREYTVLIDPPGTPGIVPATDEPDARPQSSGFPVPDALSPVELAKRASVPVQQPPTTPANDPLAEQLAASVLLNQQLQKTVDELNLKLQAQDILIADGKKQISDLQVRLAEVQQPPPAPVVAAPTPTPVTAPAQAEEDALNWPLLGGLLAVLALLGAGLFVRRRRQQTFGSDAPPPLPLRNEPEVEDAQPGQAMTASHRDEQRDEPVAGDVLEAVGIYLAYGRLGEAVGLLRDALHKEPQRIDLGLQLLEVLGRQGDTPAYDEQENHLRELGVDQQQLRDIRTHHPKLVSAAALIPVLPFVSAAPVVPAEPAPLAAEDDFELNLEDLSIDSSWDLDDGLSATDKSLDDEFLDAFGDPDQSLELEPLELQPAEPVQVASAGKLEQAQTCIDDGDLDSAIALLNELLKEADEPLRQTARTLLAGIR
ncbi:FimV/HubP family polar landmark protein [Pseudomonas sp. TWP3-1]|uniref:FimV/HubP family polar landmark protein n=1 Tax=Pseudomonas sp. TWP3-1 TaxID=2804631 RepID=UPI003CFB9027